MILRSHCEDDVIVGSQQMCAQDHNRCDPTITRSRSSDLKPDKEGEVSQIWAEVSRELKLQMTNGTWATWILPSRLLSLGCGRAVITVPTEYVRDWLQNRMDGLIKRTLGGVVGCQVIEIGYVLEDEEMSRGPPVDRNNRGDFARVAPAVG